MPSVHYRNASTRVRHAPHRRFHSLRVVNRRCHHNLVVVLYRYVFEHLHNLGQEGIRDFPKRSPKECCARNERRPAPAVLVQ